MDVVKYCHWVTSVHAFIMMIIIAWVSLNIEDKQANSSTIYAEIKPEVANQGFGQGEAKKCAENASIFELL